MILGCFLPSPIGDLLLCEEDGAIMRLALPGRPRPDGWFLDSTPLLREAASQLEAYFAGRLRTFDLPVHQAASAFAQDIYRAMSRIPYGQILPYAALAEQAGHPGAFRAAGSACGKNAVPIIVPCHRVVAKGGIGGFSGDLAAKRALLALEGVTLP